MGRRVLLVEDDPRNRYLVQYLLEHHGFEVVVACDGEEGIARADDSRPDLILLDMHLPKVDGYEIARRLSASGGPGNAPIVGLTAYSMAGDREKVLQAGCTGYIAKPIDPSTFVDEVEGFLPGGDARETGVPG